MKTGSISIMIILGVFLLGPAGIATAGGMERSLAPRQVQQGGEVPKVILPVMATNDYLEWLEIEKGIETGSLTAPGVAPTVMPGSAEPLKIPDGG